MSNPRTQSETSSSIHQSSDLLEYHRLHMEMTLKMEKMKMEMEMHRMKEQREMAKGFFSMLQLGFNEIMRRVDRDQARMEARLELEQKEMEMEKQRRAEQNQAEEWEKKYWVVREAKEKLASKVRREERLSRYHSDSVEAENDEG